VQSAVTNSKSLHHEYATATLQISSYYLLGNNKRMVNNCPQVFTSAGAQRWANTAMQSAVTSSESLHHEYATATPQISSQYQLGSNKWMVKNSSQVFTSAGARRWAHTAMQSAVSSKSLHL
jgi:hypothetical protein